MTHTHPATITIDDARYPGQVAEVLAWDWAVDRVARTMTLLLRGSEGQFLAHRHIAPAGIDLIVTLEADTALLLYRQLHVHVVPFEKVRNSA